MFQKIDIEKFGLFNDFQWTKYIDENLFNKINIIYGRNYSGKTTLSRIFESINKGILPEKYRNGIFTLTDNEGVEVSNSDLSTNYKIRVYNSDFIKDNLSWLIDDENGEIKPFTLLGSGNVTAQKRIDKIEVILGSVEKETGLYYKKEEKRIEKETSKLEEKRKVNIFQDKLKTQANQVIKKDKYCVKQGQNYNISNIQREIKDIKNSSNSFLLSDEEKEKHKNIIDEVEKTTLISINATKPKLNQFVEETKALISKRITVTDTIKELLEDSLLQNWVEKGIEYHRNKHNKCAFCGNEIDPDRWKELDAHFSRESEELKQLIEAKISTIEGAKNQIGSYLEDHKIIKDNFYTVFHSKFDDLFSKWEDIIAEYIEVADVLIEKLNERYTDIFKPKPLSSEQETLLSKSNEIANNIAGILDQFKLLSMENKTKSGTLSDDKDNSRKLLRYSLIENFLKTIDYDFLTNEVVKASVLLKTKETELKNINKEIGKLEEEKKQKELELNDEGEAAKKVNNHLKNFFGHDGLTLKPETIHDENPRTGFVIMRGDEKAFNLSEGECSLISFCYFIAKMEDELNSTDNKNLIIYIDDPISSLDNNHIFFMFSLIDSVIVKNQNYRQVFISTHNLEFLKYLKRLTFPHIGNVKQVSHFIIEKQKKDTDARAILKNMPSYLKDYVTEYNFLFKEIYTMAKTFNKGCKAKCYENQFTHLYNLPNNMRKFLESYLFYRFPNTESPLKNLPLLFDDHVPVLVNRVVNEFSHLSWGERGTLVMDVQEAEAVAKEILKAIKKKDSGHFNALCESVKVEKEIDLN